MMVGDVVEDTRTRDKEKETLGVWHACGAF